MDSLTVSKFLIIFGLNFVIQADGRSCYTCGTGHRACTESYPGVVELCLGYKSNTASCTTIKKYNAADEVVDTIKSCSTLTTMPKNCSMPSISPRPGAAVRACTVLLCQKDRCNDQYSPNAAQSSSGGQYALIPLLLICALFIW